MKFACNCIHFMFVTRFRAAVAKGWLRRVFANDRAGSVSANQGGKPLQGSVSNAALQGWSYAALDYCATQSAK